MALHITDLTQLRIGVLYGGNSPERPGSIASGEAAFKSLSAQGARTDLLDIDGIAWDALPGRIDVALLASHGLGGEDGKVQGVLDTLGIPYTGSGVMASALGMHKPTFKKMLAAEHIDTPRWVEVAPSWPVATAVPRSAARSTGRASSSRRPVAAVWRPASPGTMPSCTRSWRGGRSACTRRSSPRS